MRHGLRQGGSKMAGLAGRSVAAAAVALMAAAGLALPLSAPAGALASVTPDTLYVADQACSCVWQVPPDGQPEVYVGGNETPPDVTVDPAGDLFWTEANDSAVRELTAGLQEETLATGYAPWGIGVDDSGDVFFGAFGGTAGVTGLYEIPAGGSPELLTPEGGAWASLAIDGNGDVWGVGGSDQLLLLPAGTSSPVEVNVPGTYDVTGVRLDADDDLFATTGYGDNAVELPAGATSETVLGTLNSYTEGIAVDPSGNVFVGEPSTVSGYGKVYEITPGNAPALYASGEIGFTGGLAVNPTPQPAARAATTVTLSGSPGSSSITTTTPVDLTATVSSGAGLVQFDDNGSAMGEPVAVSGGTAVLDTTLPSGTDGVTATYLGDTGDAPASSAPVSYTVSPVASTTILSAPDGTKVPGDSYATVKVRVTGAGPTPTGGAEILANGVDVGSVELTDGTGTTTVDINPGKSKMTAEYWGDDVYDTSSSNSVTFTTVPPYPPGMSATVAYGKPTASGAKKATITVTMTGTKGAGAPFGKPTATDGFTCKPLKKTAVGSIDTTTTCTDLVPKKTGETVDIDYAGTTNYLAADTSIWVDNGKPSGGD